MGKTFGYTDKKLKLKAEKRHMGVREYMNYLKYKQRAYRSKAQQKQRELLRVV